MNGIALTLDLVVILVLTAFTAGLVVGVIISRPNIH